MANQLDTLVVDEHQKRAAVVNVMSPSDKLLKKIKGKFKCDNLLWCK